MKMAVINLLESEDLKKVSRVNRDAYYLTLPAIFKVSFVTLSGLYKF